MCCPVLQRGLETAVAVHGLFSWGQGDLLGVTWWLPPTKPAAQSVSADWQSDTRCHDL